MSCHICTAEAVARCYTCGELVCAEHCKDDSCPHCSTGFAAGDPRGSHISVEPISQPHKNAWWRPQQAEEYIPPACYQCKGLARLMCRNCSAAYCGEHAGSHGLCQECSRSANLGLYVFAGMLIMLVIFFISTGLFR